MTSPASLPPTDRLVAILSDLIAIPSAFPPGDTRAICAYAADFLRRAGYEPAIVSRAEGLDNCVARIGPGGGPTIAFNAHADTVGVGERAMWRTDPFQAVVEDGEVFGLGAGNCKGSMAVQLWLAEELARRGGPARGEVIFTFVADEENLGPDGMYHLREAGIVRPDMLILGAQTENQLITAERGVMWVRIVTTGRAAHAGNPAAGDNAILRMMRVLEHLDLELGARLSQRRDANLRSTMNVGLVRGGHNTNVVPNQCMVEIDRRLLPDETVEAAFDEMLTIAGQVDEPDGSVQVEFLRGTNGFAAPRDGRLVQAFGDAVLAHRNAPVRFLDATGVSDGRYFAEDGIEIVNFGPGSGAQGHAANESVPIDQLVDSAAIQIAVLERLVGTARR
ncbi:ArgE/DapE family deacylase [Arenibaculum sp.]|jgi:acetylornithine deacetylase/succinyl-diaminopimelate desuccinylase family protein|uniref:M20 family metallopeptidase n=1 Tax=Arenibaculum sp. TaxID=2865862 RepID=UPI002E0E46AE|nr:ArgE/DapE family deacylase [Arenibaculum sp.]